MAERMRSAKACILIAVLYGTASDAFAQDPRGGTLACVVERAFVFDGQTGERGNWKDHAESFVLRVSTCAAVKAGQFQITWPRECDDVRQDNLVIRTTIKGFEEGWLPALPFVMDEKTGEKKDMGVFDSTTITVADGLDSIPPRLRLKNDLTFDFIVGSAKGGETTLSWFTLRGHCMPFQN